jgi:hypothetical protein
MAARDPAGSGLGGVLERVVAEPAQSWIDLWSASYRQTGSNCNLTGSGAKRVLRPGQPGVDVGKTATRLCVRSRANVLKATY